MARICSYAARAVLAAGVAALVACGGGGSSAPPPPAPLAPSIAQQPASQSVAAGGSATFSVSASGDAPLSYQWQRNGVDVAGAGSSTYTLGSALLPDQGAGFAAKVSNGVGTVISSTATLSVQPAGTLTLVAGTVTLALPTPAFLDGPAASARFAGVTGLAVDGAGNIFATDSYNQVVRRISTDGMVSTFAGTPGVSDPTGAAGFNLPAGLAIDGAGTLYVANGFPPVFGLQWQEVRAISAQGVVTPFVQRRVFVASLAVDTAGNVYVDGARITPAGQASGIDTSAAGQAWFYGHAVGADGSYYFASNNSIWKNPAGSGSVLLAGASTAGTADGPAQQARFTFSGTGIPIPQFQLPMVADSAGNLYLCDDNNLRRVARDGTVTTLTGRPGMLAGVGVNGLENQPFTGAVLADRPSCTALALRGDKTLYIGRGGAVLKLQLP
ncbi:hypothetical protein ACFPOE_00195 [Caenimonas terrae]|uniref:Ig-like domain-containing protein n=1 Tax=Caenimonas terrae TaxID=696074 RepID=A0ABW0N7M1_9BURK